MPAVPKMARSAADEILAEPSDPDVAVLPRTDGRDVELCCLDVDGGRAQHFTSPKDAVETGTGGSDVEEAPSILSENC